MIYNHILRNQRNWSIEYKTQHTLPVIFSIGQIFIKATLASKNKNKVMKDQEKICISIKESLKFSTLSKQVQGLTVYKIPTFPTHKFQDEKKKNRSRMKGPMMREREFKNLTQEKRYNLLR